MAAVTGVVPLTSGLAPSPSTTLTHPTLIQHSLATTAAMDRSRYSSGNNRNPPPNWTSQDARSGVPTRAAANLAVQPPSNLAIQPAANAGSIRLKKKTVKIVGPSAPEGTVNSTPTNATFPASATTTAAAPTVKVEPATDVLDK